MSEILPLELSSFPHPQMLLPPNTGTVSCGHPRTRRHRRFRFFPGNYEQILMTEEKKEQEEGQKVAGGGKGCASSHILSSSGNEIKIKNISSPWG